MNIYDMLTAMESKLKEIKINFEDLAWRKPIEKKAGWYFIKTDMPLDKLALLEHDGIKGHIDFAKTLRETKILVDMGLSQIPKSKKPYVIYNGERSDLFARSYDHGKGGKGTGCLALGNVAYRVIRKYNWWFCWVYVSDVFEDIKDNPNIRVVLEQAWRVKNGWPLLCRK